MDPTASDTPDPIANAPKRSPYALIRDAILSGEFPGGHSLVELSLAEWCRVSRTPVREALLRLEQDGLIVRKGRELVVRVRSQDEILDIYETRIVLEGQAAAVAADRRTRTDVVNLRYTAGSLRDVDATSPPAMATANRAFHARLWHASHNESLIDLLSRLDVHLARYPETTLSAPDRWTEAIEEHERIVDAVEARDAALARALAEGHFTKARDIRLQLWASHGPDRDLIGR